MDDPPGRDTVRADKDPLMHSRAEKIDRDEWRLVGSLALLILFLAKKHGESFQAGMAAGRDRIPDDAAQKHGR